MVRPRFCASDGSWPRLVVLRDSVVTASYPASVMRRNDGKPRDLVI
jgi:hypothetical protein